MTKYIIIIIIFTQAPLFLLGQNFSISLDIGYGFQFSPDAIHPGDRLWRL